MRFCRRMMPSRFFTRASRSLPMIPEYSQRIDDTFYHKSNGYK